MCDEHIPAGVVVERLVKNARAEERGRWVLVLRAWARQSSFWAAEAISEETVNLHVYRTSSLDDAAESMEQDNDAPLRSG